MKGGEAVASGVHENKLILRLGIRAIRIKSRDDFPLRIINDELNHLPGRTQVLWAVRFVSSLKQNFPPTTTPPVIVKHSTATNYELKAPLLLQSLKEIREEAEYSTLVERIQEQVKWCGLLMGGLVMFNGIAGEIKGRKVKHTFNYSMVLAIWYDFTVYI